jgi:hypothetical protein
VLGIDSLVDNRERVPSNGGCIVAMLLRTNPAFCFLLASRIVALKYQLLYFSRIKALYCAW